MTTEQIQQKIDELKAQKKEQLKKEKEKKLKEQRKQNAEFRKLENRVKIIIGGLYLSQINEIANNPKLRQQDKETITKYLNKKAEQKAK